MERRRPSPWREVGDGRRLGGSGSALDGDVLFLGVVVGVVILGVVVRVLAVLRVLGVLALVVRVLALVVRVLALVVRVLAVDVVARALRGAFLGRDGPGALRVGRMLGFVAVAGDIFGVLDLVDVVVDGGRGGGLGRRNGARGSRRRRAVI